MNPYEFLMQNLGRLNGLRGMAGGTPARIPPEFARFAPAPASSPLLGPGNVVPRAAQGGGSNPIVGPRSTGSPFKLNTPKNIKNLGRGALAQLGLMGIDAIGQAVNPEFARKRGIQQLYQDATGDPGYALTTEEMQRRLERGVDTDPLAMRARYGGSGDMDAGDAVVVTDNRVETNVPGRNLQPGAGGGFAPSQSSATTSPPPPRVDAPLTTPNNLPPSPDQSMMDPYAYNLAVYGQGRNLATTKDERGAVRDLGLAINRKLFPKLNKTQDINPLMQATFPERYNDTLTGNIESRGTTLPGSMTEADSGSELATAQVQDTPYQAQFMRGMQEAQIADANRMVEQLLGQAEVDEIRRRLGM